MGLKGGRYYFVLAMAPEISSVAISQSRGNFFSGVGQTVPSRVHSGTTFLLLLWASQNFCKRSPMLNLQLFKIPRAVLVVETD